MNEEEKQKAVTAKVIERTLVLVKPDGVQRGLIGEVISRFERRGLKIVALKMVKPSLDHIDSHYPKDKDWVKRLGEKGLPTFKQYGLDVKEFMGTDNTEKIGTEVRKWLIDYLSAAPVVAMIVEGIAAIEMVRKIAGPTLPGKAEIGTIRGDFSTDVPAAANLQKRAVKNIVHASENKEEAENEIGLWFSQEEITSYDRTDHAAMF